MSAAPPHLTASGGTLLVIGTPIGNLGDLSPRAVEALEQAAFIACEDTRRTGGLCHHLGIDRPPFIVLNEHSEREATERIRSILANGGDVAVVSDAGMPGISDPGARLIRAVIDDGVLVTTVPGPTALISAVILSGLATDRFVFEGFLARKGHERSAQLRAIAAEERTVIVYESPRRLRATLADLIDHCGGSRPGAVARELTKVHEEIRRGTLAELYATFDQDPKGEIVIVIGGVPPAPVDDAALGAMITERLNAGMSVRDTVAEIVAATGAAKRQVYALATAASSAGT